jgi:hypothetical protein
VFENRRDRLFRAIAASSDLGLPLRFIRSSTTGPLTDLLIVSETPLLEEHITLCVALKKLCVPVRNPVAGSFAPIYGRCSYSVRNGLHKEKIYVAATPPSSRGVDFRESPHITAGHAILRSDRDGGLRISTDVDAVKHSGATKACNRVPKGLSTRVVAVAQ